MPRIAKTSITIPNELPRAERDRLIDRLYAVHSLIFDGVKKEAFARYVVESPAEYTWIQQHENGEGTIVGYFALHIFERELQGRPMAIVRAEAGSRRDYRGAGANAGLMLTRVIRYMLANPKRRCFYLGSLVHPSSYSEFVKYAYPIWPNPGEPVPADVEAFMCALAQGFGLKPVAGRKPLVRQVGWQTRDSEHERRYWLSCTKPAVRFFVEDNPGYHEGHGLLTLVPISNGVLLRAATRMARERCRRTAQATMATVLRLPLAPRILRRRVAANHLRNVELFADLDDDNRRLLAEAARVVSVPAGHYLIQEGDPGDAMYAIAHGAAYVLIADGPEQRIVDELGTGAIFGEMALLTGEARTASVRTATAATLMRFERDTLLSLMSNDTRVHDAVWQAFVERRFDTFLLASKRFEHLSYDDRLAWVRSGRCEELPYQADFTCNDAEFVFIATGSVEIQQGNSWVLGRAPLLLDPDPQTRMVARSPTRLVHLPLPERSDTLAPA